MSGSSRSTMVSGRLEGSFPDWPQNQPIVVELSLSGAGVSLFVVILRRIGAFDGCEI